MSEVWKRASDLRPGDRVANEIGAPLVVAKTSWARWIKDADGYLVNVEWGNGTDEVVGRSAEYLMAQDP